MTRHPIHEEVRTFYADAAKTADCGEASCCGPDPSPWGTANYEHLDEDLPDAATLASLGCGNPVMVAELRPGETVDVIISNCVINLSPDKPQMFADAGFTDVEITLTNTVADGVHTAIIRATKPAHEPESLT